MKALTPASTCREEAAAQRAAEGEVCTASSLPACWTSPPASFQDASSPCRGGRRRMLSFARHACARCEVTPRCHERKTKRPERKRRGQSADRRTFHWRHHTDAAAHPAGCARLSALHRGSRLGDRTPPLSFGPRFALWRIVTSARIAVHAGLRTLSAAKLSQTPGRLVVMPAGSMPKAARERSANPRAGAALAPHSGQPSGKRPSVSELAGYYHIGDNCQ